MLLADFVRRADRRGTSERTSGGKAVTGATGSICHHRVCVKGIFKLFLGEQPRFSRFPPVFRLFVRTGETTKLLFFRNLQIHFRLQLRSPEIRKIFATGAIARCLYKKSSQFPAERGCREDEFSIKRIRTVVHVSAWTTSPDFGARATFNGRHVHVFASFHSDGIHLSVLKEPNCGLFDGTSKTPPSNQPQCAKGIAPAGSTESTDDEGEQALYQALAQGQRGTIDKHITAEFTGIFRCDPCTSRKYFKLEIERTKNISVTMKDVNPHRPTS